MKLIDHGRAEDLCQAKAYQLRSAESDGIEARNAGAALRRRVGIVEAIVVKVVVCGKGSEAGMSVDSRRALVIAEGLIVCRRRKGVLPPDWAGG